MREAGEGAGLLVQLLVGGIHGLQKVGKRESSLGLTMQSFDEQLQDQEPGAIQHVGVKYAPGLEYRTAG